MACQEVDNAGRRSSESDARELGRDEAGPAGMVLIVGQGGGLARCSAVIQEAGLGRPTRCVDTEEALACLADIHNGLVILGAGPCSAAGEEGIARLRDRCPHVPVIVISDSRDEGLQDRCLRAGAAGFLFAPVFPARLTATVLWARAQADAVRAALAGRLAASPE